MNKKITMLQLVEYETVEDFRQEWTLMIANGSPQFYTHCRYWLKFFFIEEQGVSIQFICERYKFGKQNTRNETFKVFWTQPAFTWACWYTVPCYTGT